MIGYIKDLARAPEIVPKIFNFFFFSIFLLIFSIFFARTVYITIQCDRVYIYRYILRTWQGPQKLFRAFFIFFNFFYFFDFFLIFSIFFARTVYITIQCDRVYIYILRTWQGPQKLFRAFFIFFNFFYFFDFF